MRWKCENLADVSRASEFYAGLFVYTNSTTVSFSEEKSCHLAAIAVVYGWKILDEKRKMVLVQKDVGTTYV